MVKIEKKRLVETSVIYIQIVILSEDIFAAKSMDKMLCN